MTSKTFRYGRNGEEEEWACDDYKFLTWQPEWIQGIWGEQIQEDRTDNKTISGTGD